MYHLAPIVAGVFAEPTGADATFVKQVGFADFYLGSRQFPHKVGIIQSLPVPGPLMLEKAAPRVVPRRLLGFLRKRLLPLLGIVEDLPQPDNRVTLTDDGRAQLNHAFSAYDLERGQWLSKKMKGLLRAAGALFCLSTSRPSDEHIAHQCGTLRFGRSVKYAPVDSVGRLFGHENVFVVDASVFPTSLGVGPALTIMANALRTARTIVGEL